MNNINIHFDFDEESDILYISLGTNEPSYCEEIDDILLVERGYFSHQITGFQIMDIRRHGIHAVQIETFIKKAVKKEREELKNYFENRTQLPAIIRKNLTRDKRIRNLLQNA